MGDSLKAVFEDTEEYLRLCRKYGEVAKGDEQGANPYCTHAYALKEREQRENEEMRVRQIMRSPEMIWLSRVLKQLLGRLEDEQLSEKLVDVDPNLKKWWKDNRQEYDTAKAAAIAEAERARLAKSGKEKLSPEERKALGIK